MSSELQGLPKGYTRKVVVIRFNNDATGKTTGNCHFVLNDPIYNVVYVDWLAVSNNTYGTASALLGKYVTVKQFKNDGQFTQSTANGGNDFRFWAYIDSQSNQTSQPFPDDMFSPPINLRELDVHFNTYNNGNVDCSNENLILQLWCKTSM
jgi:hypothetical protein